MKANKLSLNNYKKVDYIPDTRLFTIKREYQVKFLGEILVENLTWRKHTNNTKYKIFDLSFYKAKFLLTKKCLKSIYFSCINSYINYANKSWANNLINKQEAEAA